MPSSDVQQQLFITAMGLAWVAVFAHIMIYRRLQALGFPVRWFGYPRNLIAAYGEYYRESLARHWSRVPLYAAVASEIGVVIVGVLFFVIGAHGQK